MISGKLISFLSPSRPPHILHLLSAGSTPAGLISTVFPPSWARLGSSCLHSPRSEVWISPSPFMSPLLGRYNLHPWPLASHSLQDPCPQPLAGQRAWPSGTMPTYLAGSPRVLPRGRLQSVFLTSLTHTGPDLLLVSSTRQFPEAFGRKEDLCVWVMTLTLNALLSGHVQSRGVAYQSWPACSPPNIISTRHLKTGLCSWATCFGSQKNGQPQECCWGHMRLHC